MLSKAKKHFSQNWLVDSRAIEKVINAAEISPGVQVLEIGPGTGEITQALINAKARVIAVEFDKDLIIPLRERFQNRVVLINNDALAVPIQDYNLSLPYILVSSLPYHITSDVIRKFLTEQPKPKRIVFVVQKEVADRIVVAPPDMSLLSVVSQLYARVKKVSNIKAGAFRPIPKVDSAIVRFDLKPQDETYEPERVISIAKIGFSSKRKQLKNNLATVFNIDTKSFERLLEQLGIDKKARAQELGVDDWINLTKKLGEIVHKKVG